MKERCCHAAGERKACGEVAQAGAAWSDSPSPSGVSDWASPLLAQNEVPSNRARLQEDRLVQSPSHGRRRRQRDVPLMSTASFALACGSRFVRKTSQVAAIR